MNITATLSQLCRYRWSRYVIALSLTVGCWSSLTGVTADAAIKTATMMTSQVTARTQPTSEPESVDSWMPNKRLQKAVLAGLQKVGKAPEDGVSGLTKESLEKLNDVVDRQTAYIDGTSEYSLEGLQYATNLKTINIGMGFQGPTEHWFGDVVDVSPLKNLQFLWRIDLKNNRIKDVTPLKELKNVTSLDLRDNQIEDFSKLSQGQYATLEMTNQLIFRPRTTINQKARTAHMEGNFHLPGDQLDPLTQIHYYHAPVATGTEGVIKSSYFFGGHAVPDGHGGLDINIILDQKPGITGPNLRPLPDYYYLMGQSKDQIFTVIQPYALAAGPVTVHYQDMVGQDLEEPEVIQGLVGKTYATKSKKFTGYYLKKISGQTTGTFTDKPQTVTYVYARDAPVIVPQPDAPSGDTDGNVPDSSDPDNSTTDNTTNTPDGSNPDGSTTDNTGNTPDGSDPDDSNTDNTINAPDGSDPDGSTTDNTGNTPDGSDPDDSNTDNTINAPDGSDPDDSNTDNTTNTPDGSNPDDSTTDNTGDTPDDSNPDDSTTGNTTNTPDGSDTDDSNATNTVNVTDDPNPDNSQETINLPGSSGASNPNATSNLSTSNSSTSSSSSTSSMTNGSSTIQESETPPLGIWDNQQPPLLPLLHQQPTPFQPAGTTATEMPIPTLVPTSIIFTSQGPATGKLPQTNATSGQLMAWLGAAGLLAGGLIWVNQRYTDND
ncbi:MucBP domain-containing protein [Levilactobacillus suantsaii]|uniref:MucBP domain-containing protein n=1 Tax=Levilactobacillus suantsaii TaxID=2292255 RepID=UPI0015F3D7C5|nr:MucBP domain-containing protein [Levilactobacillus suantsaii]QMU09005.1 MucBP domain-containing protein [Levilactobacillus suantsaii]